MIAVGGAAAGGGGSSTAGVVVLAVTEGDVATDGKAGGVVGFSALGLTSGVAATAGAGVGVRSVEVTGDAGSSSTTGRVTAAVTIAGLTRGVRLTTGATISGSGSSGTMSLRTTMGACGAEATSCDVSAGGGGSSGLVTVCAVSQDAKLNDAASSMCMFFVLITVDSPALQHEFNPSGPFQGSATDERM